MKRIFFLTFLISVMTTGGYSQFLSLGIKGGIGFSTLHTYDDGELRNVETKKRLANFNGGIMLDLKISERWYFHSEILFEDKGARYIDYNDSIPAQHIYNVTTRQRIHNYYIDFPQTIRYLIPVSKKNKVFLYVEAGGYFGYYLGSRRFFYKAYNGKELERFTKNFYYDETSEQVITFHKFDWGVTGGIGCRFSVWKGQFDANFKYERMIQPWASYNSVKAFYDIIGFTIGYSLPVLNKVSHR
ncbi:MAG: porin family protein [Bacteroidota bacterium]